MIHTLSLPLFVTSSICLLMSLFFSLLYYRLAFHHKEPVKYYFLFALSAFVSAIFFGAFGVLINASESLVVLSVSNRLTIIGAMFILVISLHFYLAFFNYRAPSFLKWCYVISSVFSLLTVVPSPYFLDNVFYATSKYYTGLKYGFLFELWGLWILILGSYCIYVLLKVFARQRSLLKNSNTVVLLLITNTIWLFTGISDTLTGIEVLDAPPLTWVGSFLVTCTIAWVLVLHIDELYEERRMLNHQLMYDHLTHAFSRSYLEVKLAESLNLTAQGELESMALCLFDIDNFKTINDKYGHASGDMLLKNITEIVKENIRPSDCIARLGGDEFVILLSDSDTSKNGPSIVERIRKQIALKVFEIDEHAFSASCSFGVVFINSAIPNTEDPAHELLSVADEALYEAKNKGKNAVSAVNYSETLVETCAMC